MDRFKSILANRPIIENCDYENESNNINHSLKYDSSYLATQRVGDSKDQQSIKKKSKSNRKVDVCLVQKANTNNHNRVSSKANQDTNKKSILSLRSRHKLKMNSKEYHQNHYTKDKSTNKASIIDNQFAKIRIQNKKSLILSSEQQTQKNATVNINTVRQKDTFMKMAENLEQMKGENEDSVACFKITNHQIKDQQQRQRHKDIINGQNPIHHQVKNIDKQKPLLSYSLLLGRMRRGQKTKNIIDIKGNNFNVKTLQTKHVNNNQQRRKTLCSQLQELKSNRNNPKHINIKHNDDKQYEFINYGRYLQMKFSRSRRKENYIKQINGKQNCIEESLKQNEQHKERLQYLNQHEHKLKQKSKSKSKSNSKIQSKSKSKLQSKSKPKPQQNYKQKLQQKLIQRFVLSQSSNKTPRNRQSVKKTVKVNINYWSNQRINGDNKCKQNNMSFSNNNISISSIKCYDQSMKNQAAGSSKGINRSNHKSTNKNNNKCKSKQREEKEMVKHNGSNHKNHTQSKQLKSPQQLLSLTQRLQLLAFRVATDAECNSDRSDLLKRYEPNKLSPLSGLRKQRQINELKSRLKEEIEKISTAIKQAKNGDFDIKGDQQRQINKERSSGSGRKSGINNMSNNSSDSNNADPIIYTKPRQRSKSKPKQKFNSQDNNNKQPKLSKQQHHSQQLPRQHSYQQQQQQLSSSSPKISLKQQLQEYYLRLLLQQQQQQQNQQQALTGGKQHNNLPLQGEYQQKQVISISKSVFDSPFSTVEQKSCNDGSKVNSYDHTKLDSVRDDDGSSAQKSNQQQVLNRQKQFEQPKQPQQSSDMVFNRINLLQPSRSIVNTTASKDKYDNSQSSSKQLQQSINKQVENQQKGLTNYQEGIPEWQQHKLLFIEDRQSLFVQFAKLFVELLLMGDQQQVFKVETGQRQKSFKIYKHLIGRLSQPLGCGQLQLLAMIRHCCEGSGLLADMMDCQNDQSDCENEQQIPYPQQQAEYSQQQQAQQQSQQQQVQQQQPLSSPAQQLPIEQCLITMQEFHSIQTQIVNQLVETEKVGQNSLMIRQKGEGSINYNYNYNYNNKLDEYQFSSTIDQLSNITYKLYLNMLSHQCKSLQQQQTKSTPISFYQLYLRPFSLAVYDALNCILDELRPYGTRGVTPVKYSAGLVLDQSQQLLKKKTQRYMKKKKNIVQKHAQSRMFDSDMFGIQLGTIIADADREDNQYDLNTAESKYISNNIPENTQVSLSKQTHHESHYKRSTLRRRQAQRLSEMIKTNLNKQAKIISQQLQEEYRYLDDVVFELTYQLWLQVQQEIFAEEVAIIGELFLMRNQRSTN